MKKICVLGLGYIGLPTAVTLASYGFKVVGIDINEEIINTLNSGKLHIEEPHMEQLFKSVISKGNITVKTVPEEADTFIIAVPTPKTEENACELKYVTEAARSIVPYLKKGNLVIIESTVAPGTTEETIKPIIESSGLKAGEQVYLAHCPERVMPGNVLYELVNNDRIIGGYTENCAKEAAKIYEIFTKGNLILTNLKTAEMTKLIENAYRDVNIALANELVKVCEHLGINALEVIELANKHPRVNILKPGPGVGGHCLAIDPYFIISKAPKEAELIAMARKVNCSMPQYVTDKVKNMTAHISNPKIAILGLTYKENIDDLRESPAIEIIELLKEAGYEIAVFDPHVRENLPHLTSLDSAVEKADMILVLAGHEEFKKIDYISLIKKMRTPIIFDTRNVIDKDRNSGVLIRQLGNLI